jgi:hypothetical protein
MARGGGKEIEVPDVERFGISDLDDLTSTSLSSSLLERAQEIEARVERGEEIDELGFEELFPEGVEKYLSPSSPVSAFFRTAFRASLKNSLSQAPKMFNAYLVISGAIKEGESVDFDPFFEKMVSTSQKRIATGIDELVPGQLSIRLAASPERVFYEIARNEAADRLLALDPKERFDRLFGSHPDGRLYGNHPIASFIAQTDDPTSLTWPSRDTIAIAIDNALAYELEGRSPALNRTRLLAWLCASAWPEACISYRESVLEKETGPLPVEKADFDIMTRIWISEFSSYFPTSKLP